MDPSSQPMGSPVAVDEAERLQDLSDLDLLGTPDVPPLDGIPELAARICDRPWGGVTLVQEDTQRFLASKGPFPREVPREHSICAHAIANPEECYEVGDLAQHPVHGENPVVDEYGARFYAAAPIQGPRGHGLGTVCVYDDTPGELDQEQREALTILGWFVSTQLSLYHRTRELQEANDELDRFTTFVSHELTDPITQVVSNLELLQLDLAHADEEIREILADARAGAERMDRMVKDLLRYGRASGRPLEIEPTPIDEVAAEIREALDHRLEAPDDELQVAEIPPVKADERLLRRVLENLVRNGLEHGDTPVCVEGEREDDLVRIWVEDDGDGIDPLETDELFELFERGPSPSGDSSGVGLALCRRIVERHGGEIGVDSRPGKGARFWFTMPASEEPQRSTSA